MRDDVYDYDMENAYEAYKGTKRGEKMLSAARYMMRSDGRRPDTREELFMYAGSMVSATLDDFLDNEQLASLTEALEETLMTRLAKDRPSFDRAALHAKAAVAMEGLNVVVSDETVWDIHGFDLDEVEDMVEACMKRDDTPDVVAALSVHFGEQPEDDVHGVTMEALAADPDAWKKAEGSATWDDWWDGYEALVAELRDQLPDLPDVYWQLYAMASDINVASERLGQFDPHMNRITLYLYPIVDKAEKLDVDFEAVLAAVLTHEVFHALHYHWMVAARGKEDGWSSPDIPEKWRDTLEEGLADYFAYTWCRRQGRASEGTGDWMAHLNQVADDMADSWDTNEFPGWPYAGAKVFYGAELFGDQPVEALWLADDALAFDVLYATLAPDDGHWHEAREVFLDQWKALRVRWVEKDWNKKLQPLVPGEVTLHASRTSSCVLTETARVHEDGHLEIVSELLNLTQNVDEGRHLTLTPEGTKQLYELLKQKDSDTLLTALARKFKGRDADDDFENFCEKHHIQVDSVTI